MAQTSAAAWSIRTNSVKRYISTIVRHARIGFGLDEAMADAWIAGYEAQAPVTASSAARAYWEAGCGGSPPSTIVGYDRSGPGAAPVVAGVASRT